MCAAHGMVGGWLQWPFAGGPANVTYAQMVLMIAAQRTQEEPKAKKPMPRRMWEDWKKKLKHGTG